MATLGGCGCLHYGGDGGATLVCDPSGIAHEVRSPVPGLFAGVVLVGGAEGGSALDEELHLLVHLTLAASRPAHRCRLSVAALRTVV